MAKRAKALGGVKTTHPHKTAKRLKIKKQMLEEKRKKKSK
jgi:hypothetical protein